MVEAALSIDRALADFDREEITQKVENAEAKRQALLNLFSLEKWPQMTLQEYALGGHEAAEDSFCRWIEFGSDELGSIKGGSSRKLIIYKPREKPGWWYPLTEATQGGEQQAWEYLRAQFLQAFDWARDGEWERIDSLDLLGWGNSLKLKALHLYYPDEVLPIYADSHLRHFLRLFDQNETKFSPVERTKLNRTLVKTMRAHKGFRGWSLTEMAKFLYVVAHPREASAVVKIAPGENAKYWEECLAGGYICVGWDKVGDLTGFDSLESLRDRFEGEFGDHYQGNKSTITKKSKELWTLRNLESGDLVVANEGTSRVLAVGEVVDPGYQFRPERAGFQHTVSVKWDTSFAQEIPLQKRWAFVTVAKVSEALARTILGTKKAQYAPLDPIYPEIADALERKGQVILYGPPGTGKTYTARRLAVWWLLKRQGNPDARRALGDPDLLSKNERALSTAQVSRRVWWIVANPSIWSWDRLFEEQAVDYKYGRLQKNYSLVQRGDWVIGYESNPTKRIVALARIKRGLGPAKDGEPMIGLEPLHRVSSGLSYEELQEDSVLKNSEPLRFRNQGTLFALDQTEADHLLAVLCERDGDLAEFVEELEGQSDSSIGPLTRLTFHPSYSYEDFIEGFRPVQSASDSLVLRLEDGVFKRICREAQANPERDYVLLIDEINRGNIAKILGELLTLLERDKRGLTLSLPQSKETFSVPENVYLIGTMNTADRSIKLMDAALRRRFAFKELMPDISLLQGASVGELALDDFLEKLNSRIAMYEGREKQIGHSYLLKDGEPLSEIEEFASRFRQEILPLLQEFCYSEYGTLAKYLGSDLVDVEAHELNSNLLDDPERLVEALAAELTAPEPSIE